MKTGDVLTSFYLFELSETGKFRGSLTGISIGTVTQTQKIWRSFQALGAIAFAYSYSLILIEIQVTEVHVSDQIYSN